MYKRKTQDVFEVQGHYGHGFECVDTVETIKDAKQSLSCYRQNEKVTCFRIVKKRVKIGV